MKTTKICFFLLITQLLFLNAMAQTYNKGDKVWVLQPKRKAEKFMATIWSTRYLANGGYYEIMDKNNTFRATPNEILGLFDASQTKYKVGDQVSYKPSFGDWGTGTVKQIKNDKYVVEFADAKLNAEGASGLSEKQLMPAWTYKEFFAEVEAYKQSLKGQHKIDHIAKVICAECSRNGSADYFVNMNDITAATTEIEGLAKIVAKYPNPPDNGREYYDSNPKFLAMIVASKNDFIKKIGHQGLQIRVNQWYNASRLVSTLNDQEYIMDGNLQLMWMSVLCDGTTKIKQLCIENLRQGIQKYGLNTTPDDYLKEWDSKMAAIKADLEKKTVIDWSKYSITDPTYNDLVSKTFGTGFHKIVYRNSEFSIDKSPSGVIKSRQRTGTVIYKVAGCAYWRYHDFMLYQDYEGNGKYGTLKCLWSNTGYTKPF